MNRGALVRRLILFEETIIDSVRLTEIPTLTALFGVRGIERLLRSGCLRFRVEPIAIAEVGSLGSERDHRGFRAGAPLPPFSYAFSALELADLDSHLEGWLNDGIASIRDLGRKRERGLRQAIRNAIVDRHPEIARTASARMVEHLSQEPRLAHAAVALRLSEETGRDVAASDFGLELKRLGDDFTVVTDLGERFGIADTVASDVVKHGLLAVGSLHERLAEMETFEAITGFREREADLFLGHVSYLLRRDNPDSQETRFDRIAELQGLPDIHDAAAHYSLNVKSLLKLRASPECIEFRRWLRTVDDNTDEELRERLDSLRERIAVAFQARATRTVRFIAGTALDFAPGSKITLEAAKAAANAADAFLLDRLISRPGPITFLGRTYGSLFREFNRR